MDSNRKADIDTADVIDHMLEASESELYEVIDANASRLLDRLP